jgi:hypothetical protein
MRRQAPRSVGAGNGCTKGGRIRKQNMESDKKKLCKILIR